MNADHILKQHAASVLLMDFYFLICYKMNFFPAQTRFVRMSSVARDRFKITHAHVIQILDTV